MQMDLVLVWRDAPGSSTMPDTPKYVQNGILNYAAPEPLHIRTFDGVRDLEEQQK